MNILQLISHGTIFGAVQGTNIKRAPPKKKLTNNVSLLPSISNRKPTKKVPKIAPGNDQKTKEAAT